MSLATKLSLAFSGLIATAALAAWMVYSSAQQAFDQVDQQRTKAVLAQLQQRLAASKADLHQQINQAANSEVIRKILVSPGNVSLTIEAAGKEADAYRLDFLEMVGDDGSVISCVRGSHCLGTGSGRSRFCDSWKRPKAGSLASWPCA